MAVNMQDIPVLETVGGYMTIKAVMRELDMKYQDVYYLVHSRQLKSAKLDERTWLIKKTSVERYKARRAARNAEQEEQHAD